MTELKKLKLDQIRIDGGTQIRAAIDESTVGDYAEAYMAAGDLPPMVVFFDGSSHWLADGFHRFHASRRVGFIDAECEVRTGTLREALLYAVGANAEHGLRRSIADKRRAVEMLLLDQEWGKWSDREIARRCSVAHSFVGSMRDGASLDSESSEKSRVFKTKHGTESTMATAGINKGRKAEKPKPAAKKAAEPAAQPEDDDRPSTGELLEDLQRDVERLTRENKALTAADGKAELAKQVGIKEHLQRQVNDEMSKNAKLAEQRDFYMKQLRRCGKALGVDDLDKIAPAVEAFVREHRAPVKKAA